MERWTIWKGRGGDTDVKGPDCVGVDVAPVEELEAIRRQFAEAGDGQLKEAAAQIAFLRGSLDAIADLAQQQWTGYSSRPDIEAVAARALGER